jgi:hypothetical protein
VARLLNCSRDRTHNCRTSLSLRACRTGELAVSGDPAFQFDTEMFKGMALGSYFISEGEVFDYLPGSVLPRIENVEEFVGAFPLEK